jgi:hypothetical protein
VSDAVHPGLELVEDFELHLFIRSLGFLQYREMLVGFGEDL